MVGSTNSLNYDDIGVDVDWNHRKTKSETIHNVKEMENNTIPKEIQAIYEINKPEIINVKCSKKVNKYKTIESRNASFKKLKSKLTDSSSDPKSTMVKAELENENASIRDYRYTPDVQLNHDAEPSNSSIDSIKFGDGNDYYKMINSKYPSRSIRKSKRNEPEEELTEDTITSSNSSYDFTKDKTDESLDKDIKKEKRIKSKRSFLNNGKDHVHVVVRLCPTKSKETKSATIEKENSIRIKSQLVNKLFSFGAVFSAEESQKIVFSRSGIPKLIDMALRGYSSTIFAYGQTGSGKTHTITGPPGHFESNEINRRYTELDGVIPRAMHYLMHMICQKKSTTFVIKLSYLEIYNEQIIDLLNIQQNKYLQMRWSKANGFYVENLFLVECQTFNDLMTVLQEGIRNRHICQRTSNEHSSRSHTVLTIRITSEYPDVNDNSVVIKHNGKLIFVDLAGNEKIKNQEVVNSTMQNESNNINKSLLVLGKCIASLSSRRKHMHVPYRDSKLTKLLAESLGGSGLTLMIACISQSLENLAETINTLRYASRATRIINIPIIKMDPREHLIITLKRELKVLRHENHYLRKNINFPVKPKGELEKENDNNFLNFMKKTDTKEVTMNQNQKSNKTKISDRALYEMLQEYMVENEALRHENSVYQKTKELSTDQQQRLEIHNERLLQKINILQTNYSSRKDSMYSYTDSFLNTDDSYASSLLTKTNDSMNREYKCIPVIRPKIKNQSYVAKFKNRRTNRYIHRNANKVFKIEPINIVELPAKLEQIKYNPNKDRQYREPQKLSQDLEELDKYISVYSNRNRL
ncbi:hypothetical protein A3Q56_04179 [Intoshia linei]|uniref:Kinesin-like protein n=1 Tax=Intoshia linei TaxID=1819745 RepID=A0A177B1T9_9BILA|nr:hypothetical protein A3Q56_04179 [Intoshia linei]